MNGSAADRLAFTCGGMRFALARDDAGRWDHNRHGNKVLAKFGDGGGIRHIRIVDALCEMMTEGLIPRERAAGTAQGCNALSEGKSCRNVWPLDKTIMFLALAAQDNGGDPQIEDFPSAKKWGYEVTGQYHHLSESAKKRHRHTVVKSLEGQASAMWLRRGMSLCDEIGERVSGGANTGISLTAGRLLVARAANWTGGAWHRDAALWSDYLEWALPKPELWDQAVDTLGVVMDDRNLPFGEGALMSGVLRRDDLPTSLEHPATTLFSHLTNGDHHHPYWELIPDTHNDMEVQVPHVGKMVAAAAKRTMMMKTLNGRRSDNALVGCDLMGGFVLAAEELWGDSVPINVFGYEAPVVLWKSALREIADASLAANSLRFGPTAGNLEECLLDSFNREGHPAWSPIYGRLVDVAADAFASIPRTFCPVKDRIATMIHNDMCNLFKAIEKKRSPRSR